LQDGYLASIAEIAGVSANRVRILQVTEVTTRRRLLGMSGVFTFEIVVARKAGREVEQIVKDDLVRIVASKGLPTPVIMLISKSCGIGKEPNNETLQCDPCAMGYYKDAPNNQSCTACPLNTYGNSTGATSRFECLRCRGLSTSPNGSTVCSCLVGTFGPPGECTQCEAGKYTDTAGSAACTACQAGTYSNSGAPKCTDCPAFSHSSTNSDSVLGCICKAGYTGNAEGLCIACDFGTFKPVNGSSACRQCPAGTFQPVRGSNSMQHCLKCPLNSTSAQQSKRFGDCSCAAGFVHTASSPPQWVKSINSFSTEMGAASRFPSALFMSMGNLAEVSLAHNTRVESWGTFSQQATRSQPVYQDLEDDYRTPAHLGAVRFNSSQESFLDGGPSTFHFQTGGGLTLVAVVRFLGGVNETLFDFGNSGSAGTGNGNNIGGGNSVSRVVFVRDGLDTFSFVIYGANETTDDVVAACGGSFASGSGLISGEIWYTLVIRYSADDNWIRAQVNGDIVMNRSCVSRPPDMTVKNCFVGKSLDNNSFFNGDILGVFVVDIHVTDADVSEIEAELILGTAPSALSVLGQPTVYPISSDFLGLFAASSDPATFDPQGRNKLMWSPRNVSSGHEWLELSFAEPVVVNAIELYETSGPGSCVKIMLRRNVSNSDGFDVANSSLPWKWDPVWESEKENVAWSSRIFAPPLQPREYTTQHIRLEFNMSGNHEFYGLDAVQLVAVFSCHACAEGKFKTLPGPGACVQCAPGKYSKATAASKDVCLSCPMDTYSAENNSMCLACPLNTSSPASSSTIHNCLCNSGYTGKGGWGLFVGAGTVSCSGSCQANCDSSGSTEGTISNSNGAPDEDCAWIVLATAAPTCGTPVLELGGGAGDYVHVAKSSSLDLNHTNFSWAAWVKRAKNRTSSDVFLSQSNGEEPCSHLSVGYTKDDRFQFQAAQTLTSVQAYPNDNGEWVHWAGTYEIGAIDSYAGLSAQQVTTFAGSGFGQQDGGADHAKFNQPWSVAVSPDGNTILVADAFNHKIRVICRLSGDVKSVAGGGVVGNVSGYQDGLASDALFKHPADIAITPDGLTALVVDRDNHCIRKIDLYLQVVSTFAGSILNGSQDLVGTNARFDTPTGIVITPDGLRVFVVDRHRIRAIAMETGAVTTLAGSGLKGYINGPDLTARFNNPLKIVLTPDAHYALVTDHDNHKIRKVDVSTGRVTTLSGSSAGFQDGVATLANADASNLAKFNGPAAIAITPDGGTAIVSDLNLRLRTVHLTSGEVGRFAGSGSNATVVDGAATAAAFNTVYGLVFTPDGSTLLVADSHNVIRAIGIGGCGHNCVTKRIYRNGHEVAFDHQSVSYAAPGDFRIGMLYPQTTGFTGRLVDLMILTRVLTRTEVQLLHTNFMLQNTTSLVLRLNFSQESVLPDGSLPDDSGNANNGVLHGVAKRVNDSDVLGAECPVGSSIAVRINSFDTAQDDDVRIYSCNTSDCTFTTIIARIAGTVDANQGTSDPQDPFNMFDGNTVFTSATGYMKITFQPSSSAVNSFEMIWSTLGESTCEACPAGTFKVNPGPSLCTLCPEGKFSIRTAEPVSETCTNCPVYSNAPSGSINASDCACKQGYTGIGGALLGGLPLTILTLSTDSKVTLSSFSGDWYLRTSASQSTHLIPGSAAFTNAAQSLVDSANGAWPYIDAQWPSTQQTCASMVYVELDFGELFFVTSIHRWMEASNCRAFCSQRVELSISHEFVGEKTVVYSCGTYEECGMETRDGKTVFSTTKYPVMAQFVRYYGSRNNVSASLQFSEIQVKGMWASRVGVPRTLSKDATITLSPYTSGNWSHTEAPGIIDGKILLPGTYAYTQGVSKLVDGDTSMNHYLSAFDAAETCATQVYVELDLQEPYLISEIARWLFWSDKSSFCNQTAMLSLTGEFSGEFCLLMNVLCF